MPAPTHSVRVLSRRGREGVKHTAPRHTHTAHGLAACGHKTLPATERMQSAYASTYAHTTDGRTDGRERK